MSIDVYKVSKSFQGELIVDQLSFRVEKGQIVGLLGPNGAGKSTTMRMLAGYLPASEGDIYICGYDMQKRNLSAKKNLGYLPENNPIYINMYVHEYLCFMGKIHKLSKKKCYQRAKEVVERCGIGDMQNKKISELSKGYKQRVGIAQTLMHDPAVLIFDEPTVGLDPNQLNHIRAVIKELSKEKAILLSTHIMQEVEAICDKVLVMHRGTLRLESTLHDLNQQANNQFTVSFKEEIPIDKLSTIEGIQKVEIVDNNKCKLLVDNNKAIYDQVFQFAKQYNLTIQRIEQKKESLEEIFTKLTKVDSL